MFALIRSSWPAALGAFALVLSSVPAFSQEKQPESLPLVVIDGGFDISSVKTREASAALVDAGNGKGIKLSFAVSDKYPDAAIVPQNGSWDLSKFGGVRMSVMNTGSAKAKIAIRVDNEGTPLEHRWNTGGAEIDPGETKQVEVLFGKSAGKEAAYPLDSSKVTAVHIFTAKPKAEISFVIGHIEAFGEPSKMVDTPEESSQPSAQPPNTKPSAPLLFGFDAPEILSRIKGTDSKFCIVDGSEGKALRVDLGSKAPYPNVTFKPAGANWNLTTYTRVEMNITNNSDESIELCARVDNPGAAGMVGSNGGKTSIDPGQTGTLTVDIDRIFAKELRAKLIGMRCTPWGMRGEFGSMIDPANIAGLQLFANKPSRPYSFTVNSIRATGVFDPASQVIPEPFFPFIDRYGQYIHQNWLNKIKTDADLAKIKADEQASINKFPRPANWDIYGGWAGGPQLEKKGHFYTVKRDGKWYLVDPDGRLFFSLGMDVVQLGKDGTAIDNRDGWFEDAPWKTTDQFKEFLTSIKAARHGDYKGSSPSCFNFYGANLKRKYGNAWEDTWRQLMPQRLTNWGFNTIGNWSDPKIEAQRKIPYTGWVFHFAKKLPWQPNTRNPIPDPFDPKFEENIRQAAVKMTRGTVDDPYCIGYFVDNELSWRDDSTQGVAALAGDASCPAKNELVKDIRAKYGDVAKLNAAWKTAFENWDAMMENKTAPKTPEGVADLRAFTAKLDRKYFETISRVLKEVAPHKLYLGCRFADHNPQVVRIAGEYCDVVSFNIYRNTIANWKPAAPIDKPVIIGEFHFGSTDRGVFGPGLVKARNTQERAEMFSNYVLGAAGNPQIAGVHWFQLVDQATTGRGSDAENYNVGFVSITDTPYKEMIDASRKAAIEIYNIRSK